MTVKVNSVRKVVEISWDKNEVKGNEVSVQVEGEEKRTVKNDGLANLTFPTGFEGRRHVVVEGIKGSKDTGHIEVN